MKSSTKLSLHLALASMLLAGLVLADGDQNPEQTNEVRAPKVVIPPSPVATPLTPTTASPNLTTTPAQTAKAAKKAKATDAPFCPPECACTDKKVACESKKLKSIPNLSKHQTVTEIDLSGNAIETVDLSLLPLSSLESLDLSENSIKSFTAKKLDTLPKLRKLVLTSNKLSSLQGFSALKMPALDTLELRSNPLEEIAAGAFSNTKNLSLLRLENTSLKRIDELAFAPMTQLRHLNMSFVKLTSPLGDRQFANNQKLESLDLTGNDLIEVPHALRSTSSIKILKLNHNNMTSLRQSDFLNRSALVDLEVRWCLKLTNIDDHTFSGLYNLERLVLSDNPSLRYISKDAFKSDQNSITLKLFDISNDNISTLSDPLEFSSLNFTLLNLNNNPWQCSCDLKWLLSFVQDHSLLAHCKGPEKYRDIEISQFFATTDCDVIDSSYHTAIVGGFLIFLVGLTILVFIQKSDYCRRLLWKDQYGTIYYTKANFPPETV